MDRCGLRSCRLKVTKSSCGVGEIWGSFHLRRTWIILDKQLLLFFMLQACLLMLPYSAVDFQLLFYNLMLMFKWSSASAVPVRTAV